MKKPTAVTIVGITAIALGLALVGCGSNTKNQTKTSTSITTTVSNAAPTTSAQAAHNETIQDYVKANHIVETPVHRGDPGSPTINIPIPPGWSDAGPSTPDRAYTAMVYDQPSVPADPPRITVYVSKLTGNVDPAQILTYSSGEMKNLPGFQQLDNGTKTTQSGFDCFQQSGNYTKDGNKRIIGQKTVVIPGHDGLYVLQMTADALNGDSSTVMNAGKFLDANVTITV